jgi:hypothetical protein
LIIGRRRNVGAASTTVALWRAGDLSACVRDDAHDFIELNREALLDYWEKRIDTDELRQRLKPLTKGR